MNIEEVIEIVREEGLQYAILDYIEPEEIDNPELRFLWEEAQDVLKDIISIFESNSDKYWIE